MLSFEPIIIEYNDMLKEIEQQEKEKADEKEANISQLVNVMTLVLIVLCLRFIL